MTMARNTKATSVLMALVVGALVALAAWAAMTGPAQAQGIEAEIIVTSVEVEPGATGEFKVDLAITGGDIGVWNFDVAYDPAVITVNSCTGGTVVTAGTISVEGSDPAGVSSGPLATCSFTAIGAAGLCSDLTLTVSSLDQALADLDRSRLPAAAVSVQGQEPVELVSSSFGALSPGDYMLLRAAGVQEITPTITNGTACVVAAAAAPATAAPTAAPAAVPASGGAPTSGGTDATTYLLIGALGLILIAGGAYVSRMRQTDI